MTTKAKKLGIWMDHSSACLIEYTSVSPESTIIESTFAHQVKEETLGKSEYIMHNKEQDRQSVYYKKLGEAILHFDEVILFGPTDAKTELLNILKADHHFDKIIIKTKQADKLTENQQFAFVRAYYD